MKLREDIVRRLEKFVVDLEEEEEEEDELNNDNN